MAENVEINHGCQILRLPDHALRDVFTLALPSIKAPPRERTGLHSYGLRHAIRLRAALNISHTCRLFREVAVGTSRLWNMLCPQLPLACIPTLLERGKVAGYHIHLAPLMFPGARKLTGAEYLTLSENSIRDFLQLTIPSCENWISLRTAISQVTPLLGALQALHQACFIRLQFLSFWEPTLSCDPDVFSRVLQQVTRRMSSNNNITPVPLRHPAPGLEFHAEYITNYYDDYLINDHHGFPTDMFQDIECTAGHFHALLDGYSHFTALSTLNIVLLTNNYALLAGRPGQRPRLPFPRLRRLQLRPPSWSSEFDILNYACLVDMEMPALEELLLDFGQPKRDINPISQSTTGDAVSRLSSILRGNSASFARVHSFSLEIQEENDFKSVDPLIALMPALRRLVLRGYCPALCYGYLTNPKPTPSQRSSAPRLPLHLQNIVYSPMDYTYVNVPYIKALLPFLEDNHQADGPIMLDIVKPFSHPKNIIPDMCPDDAYHNVCLNSFWSISSKGSPRAAWVEHFSLAEDPSRII